MVLADSGRIARVPPYLGSPLGQSPVSATGLSPSMARLSRRLVYRELVLNAVPQPRQSFLWRFSLLRFRSPLLAESRLLSFPRGTEMFHFPRFAPRRLWIQHRVRRHYPPWVSPFGHRRIKAWLAAPRRFSQLPTSFFASCRLGIHRVPFVAWSSLSSTLLTLSSRRPGSSAAPWLTRSRRRTTQFAYLPFFTALAHMQLSKIGKDRKSWWSRSGSNRRHPACKAGALPAELRPQMVGLDRFELSTPRLSSVCSNQLSYRPISPGQAPQDFKDRSPRSFKTRQQAHYDCEHL